MKTSTFLITFFLFSNVLVAQDSMEKTMEKRAREMHRVIGLSEQEQWKKFISENYSKALIERRVKQKEGTSDSRMEKPVSSSGSVTGMEEKAKMFQQLNKDFGNSKLLYIKRNGKAMEMVMENTSGLKGIFQLTFENKSPYLIDGMEIEAN